MANDQQPTDDEILGRRFRVHQPAPIPHAYQVEQWERNEAEFEAAKKDNPKIEYDSFMEGWNRAFRVIY
jgi:hypothetical protein